MDLTNFAGTSDYKLFLLVVMVQLVSELSLIFLTGSVYLNWFYGFNLFVSFKCFDLFT